MGNHNNIKRTVNVIGGFLGSGKTTLVNHILGSMKDKRADVLVREYGAVSIDDKLFNLKKENIHVFVGISTHEDTQILLYDFLEKLYHNTIKNPFDFLILESSGLDNPEALVQLFFIGSMQTNYNLGSYIALIDAEYGSLNLDEYRVAVNQIAFADVIIINKVDLADENTIYILEKRLRRINGMAKIYYAQYGNVNVDEILNIELYDQLKCLDGNIEGEGNSMDEDNIKTVVLTENRPMDMEKMNEWIKNLYVTNGMKILRSKGFLYFKDEDYRYEFQAVRKTYHSKADKKWEDNEERKSVIVLIVDGILDAKELQESFSSCAFE